MSVACERTYWTARMRMNHARQILVSVRTGQGLIGFREIAGRPQKQICDLVTLFADAAKGNGPCRDPIEILSPNSQRAWRLS